MDPYLEAHWRDVHARLIVYACDALQGVLPTSLRARVEESVLLETPEGIAPHPLYPDVRVVEYAGRRGQEAQPAAVVGMASPVLLEIEVEPVTEPFLEIIDLESGNRVVTVIEFLSPANKSPGANREQYLRKQNEICTSDANLVEIDLNRFGTHTLAFPLECLRPRARTGYMACVRRPTRRSSVEVYLMPLWERLPVVQVPLRRDDNDVPLDLQVLVDQCCRNGAYEGTLNYAVDPEPPLLGAEADWARKWLQETGLRPTTRPQRRKGKPKSR
jgi:hypothetical protein